VRRLRRLVQKRSLRWSEAVCVLEGPDLIDAALENAVEFEGIYVDVAHSGDPALAELFAKASTRGVRVFDLAPGVLEKVADAQSPQPVLAAVRFVAPQLEELEARGLIVVLHDVRDPGNAGTVIRTADAAGAAAVILSGQSVDPYNPKTLRATAGSIFHLPVVRTSNLSDATTWFRQNSLRSYAAVVRGGTDYRDVDLSESAMIVVGSEAEGLSADAAALADETISIPMAGRNESLNVSIATAVMLFEAKSQREREHRISTT
jgi:TrmH family RNA methyltransferase